MPADTDIPATAYPVNPFPPETIAGARAIYVRQSKVIDSFVPSAWEHLEQETRDAFCADFAAGLAAHDAYLAGGVE